MMSVADFQVTDPAVAAETEEAIAARRIDERVDAQARWLEIQHAAKERVKTKLAGPAKDDAGEYLSRAELGDLPRPAPLIEGVLNRHSYAILRGRDGTYKSFLALDWALSLATGRQCARDDPCCESLGAWISLWAWLKSSSQRSTCPPART
jgi:hypothetical protein